MQNNSLVNRLKKSYLWELLAIFSNQFSTLVVSVILARILTPQQFGIIGMAMVFVNLSIVFVDVGFSKALIQKKNTNQKMYSSVFFINILLGSFLSLIIYFLAPQIGDFYITRRMAPNISQAEAPHCPSYTRSSQPKCPPLLL